MVRPGRMSVIPGEGKHFPLAIVPASRSGRISMPVLQWFGTGLEEMGQYPCH